VVARMGAPDFRRFDTPARYWRYRQGDCVLGVFLYDGVGGVTVSHLEAFDADGASRPVDDCLSGF